MRLQFDEQLSLLNTELIEMGSMIEYAIDGCARALTDSDTDLSRKIMKLDAEVDGKERDIEQRCLKLLLQQQPVAKDLRFISAALKMITDMERIGDQAADICEIVLYLAGTERVKELDHIPQMAQKTARMVKRSIDAFVSRDQKAARAIIESDDEVDELFLTVKRELIDLVRINPKCGEQALDLLMIAKYFERIGDHATNIAEWVEFAVTGVHKGAAEHDLLR